MKLSGSLTAAAAAALLLPFISGPAISADRVHRSLFYDNTPFGSLAWMKGVKTRSAARDRLTVNNLADDNCIVLPAKGIQWFMINHRDPDLDGVPGYFSVRILYRTNPDAAGGAIRQGLHIQRNGNWYDGSRRVARPYERHPEQIALSEQDFIALHDPAEGDEEKSAAALEASLGPWHMAPSADDQTSWTDRHLFGARLRAYSSPGTSAISARLIRFTATSSASSADPVVFWLDPLGATSALILVDAPRHDYQGSRRVYDVLFEGICPADNAP